MNEAEPSLTVLRGILNAHKAMEDNLTACQADNTRLVEENRILRLMIADLNANLRALKQGIVLPGWTCPNEACKVFNGDEKERLEKCRACETSRPEVSSTA